MTPPEPAAKRGLPSMGSVIQGVVGALMVAAVGVAVFRFGAPPASQGTPAPAPATVRRAAPSDHVAMPRGDPFGWRQVFADDFTGRHLNMSKWRLYWGHPGGDPAGWWEPSHVRVAHGMLIVGAARDPARGERWATGGVSSSPGLVQTYGKYLVRFRMDAGIGVTHAVLLFPADNSWPPEIDFSEDSGRGRDSALATLHYGASDHHLAGKVAVNLTRWHTLGVEWLPGSLAFTLDGRDWFHLAGADVPSIPMAMDIQTQTWPCSGTWARCPDVTTPAHVNLDVDWVVAYAPASPLGAWSG
jgi:beta-glucanase (GH16 family)